MIAQFFDIPTRILVFCAILLPFLGSLFVGPYLIAFLKEKAKQPIREQNERANAPDHAKKKNTPTMGGIMIIGLVTLTTLLFGDLSDPATHSCLFVLLMTAGLGFLDDYAKITQSGTDGVSGIVKIVIQSVTAIGVSVYLFYQVEGITSILIPFWGWWDVGFWFIPLSILAIVGTSNAVNLTDGLDGLASGCVAIVAALLTIVTDSPELNIMLTSITFACLGFLWFNASPAQIFMGDTGSLALGGVLGTLAVCTGNHFTFVIMGGIFVIEACSVMLQRGWFKLSRKLYGKPRRLLLMAPIHHHFEKKGWSEPQVAIRFWIISLLFALIGTLGWYSATIQY